jgi:superfamily II DNA or RNA helicase
MKTIINALSHQNKFIYLELETGGGKTLSCPCAVLNE